MTEHDHRRPTRLVVLGLQAPSGDDRQPERGEVVAADQAATDLARGVAQADRAARRAAGRQVQRRRVLLQERELGHRDTDELIGGAMMGQHQRVRIGQPPRLQQQRVHEREERRVHADAQRQRGQRRQREPRAAPQASGGVADVLPDALNPRRDPHLAGRFARRQDMAEPLRAEVAGLVRRGAGRPQAVLGHGAVHVELVPQLRVEIPIADASPQASEPSTHHAVSRTRWMAETSSSNSARSAARCLRPSFVSE